MAEDLLFWILMPTVSGVNATQSSYLLFFGILGINEISNPVAVSTYPNPTSDKVTFAFENNLNEPSNLTIDNESGQAVESYNVTRLKSFTMTTSHLPDGMYSYIVRNEKGIKARGKFIVMH